MAYLLDNLFIRNQIIDHFQDVEERRLLRVSHRNLRDRSNPFELPEARFRKVFRLSRELAFNLCNNLTELLPQARRSTSIPNHLKILLALNFYGHGSYQGIVGEDFNFPCSQPTVSRILKEVTNVIVVHLMPAKIKFPTTPEDIMATQMEFQNKYGFPNVLGCIDCTHVAIISPPADHAVYPGAAFYNRKGYTSINVQIICNAKLKITNINARYPGSTHDAAIWQMSVINDHLRRKYYRNDLNGWLLGDSGYPLQPWLLTPIVDAPEDSPESRYTQCHMRTRNTVERLNGVLKNRFRCLLKHRTLHYLPSTAGRIIYACAVLHNMCIDQNVDIDEEPAPLEYDGHVPDIVYNGNNNILAEGLRARNNVIRNYFL